MDHTCYNWVQIVKKDQDLSFHSKAIALYLFTFMNTERDIAWPSQKRIAKELNTSKPTVIKYIKELVLNEYLVVLKVKKYSKGGEQDHNSYHANIPTKVVNELYHLYKGGKAQSQRGLSSEPKGVNGVNPNYNRNYNKNNNSEPSVKYTDEDLSLGEYLYNSILTFHPNHKRPKIKEWAADFRKLREIDKRPAGEIREMIDWVRHDEFWYANILGPTKLRKQWDQLTIKKNRHPYVDPDIDPDLDGAI